MKIASGDLRRLAQVRAVERNRRNRPTSQPLARFLAQALEDSIFHHIAHLATVSFTIGPFDPPGCRESSPLRMQFPSLHRRYGYRPTGGPRASTIGPPMAQ